MAQPSTAEILEKAIMEDPDDLAAHAAYADWLSQEGDPRGEFMQVQLAPEDAGRSPKERKELEQREKKLLKAHRRKWLGRLADYLLDQKGLPDNRRFQFQFARGWLDYIRVPQLSEPFALALAKTAESRLLRRLIIEEESYEDPGSDEFEEMLKPPQPDET